MKKMLVLAVFLLLSPVVLAQQLTPSDLANTYQQGVVSTCLDNGTLMNSLSVLRCVNNVCSTIQANATHACQFGCDAKINPNSCNPAPFQVNILLLIVVALVIIFIVAFYAYKSGH